MLIGAAKKEPLSVIHSIRTNIREVLGSHCVYGSGLASKIRPFLSMALTPCFLSLMHYYSMVKSVQVRLRGSKSPELSVCFSGSLTQVVPTNPYYVLLIVSRSAEVGLVHFDRACLDERTI